jgi:hypothetical protein
MLNAIVPVEDMLKLQFTRNNRGLSYGGTLLLLQDHSYTDEEIEALKDKQYNDWMDFVEEQSLKVTEETQSEGI